MACDPVVLTGLRSQRRFSAPTIPAPFQRYRGGEMSESKPGHAGWAWIGWALARPPTPGSVPIPCLGSTALATGLSSCGRGSMAMLSSNCCTRLGLANTKEVLAPAGTGDLPVQLLTAARSRPVIAISPSNHAGPSSETAPHRSGEMAEAWCAFEPRRGATCHLPGFRSHTCRTHRPRTVSGSVLKGLAIPNRTRAFAGIDD